MSKLNNVTLSSTSYISDQYYKSKSKSTFIANILTYSDEGSHSTMVYCTIQYEKFEVTKGIIRSHKSMDKKYNAVLEMKI